jgi:hypothetical protein
MQTVSIVEARQLVAFIAELLKYVYEFRGELARRRGLNSPPSSESV